MNLLKFVYRRNNGGMETNVKKKILEYLLSVPSGKVVTYGQIAEHLGNKHLSRAVGNALHKNPDGDKYPCYRVVNAKGKLSDSYAYGGIDEQKKRLENDGIQVENYTVDLDKYQHREKDEIQ